MPIRPIAPPRAPDSQPELTLEKADLPVTPAPRHRIRPTAHVLQEPAQAAPAEPFRAYGVGYGRPPEHTRFKPGRSGNPRGRPKAAKGLKTITRELLLPRVTVRTAAGEAKMTRIQAVLHKLVEQAMKGNPKAQTHLIGLYAAAVPDLPVNDQSQGDEALTPTDEAILAEFEAMILSKQGGGK